MTTPGSDEALGADYTPIQIARHTTLIKNDLWYQLLTPKDQDDVIKRRCRMRMSEHDPMQTILDYTRGF